VTSLRQKLRDSEDMNKQLGSAETAERYVLQ